MGFASRVKKVKQAIKSNDALVGVKAFQMCFGQEETLVMHRCSYGCTDGMELDDGYMYNCASNSAYNFCKELCLSSGDMRVLIGWSNACGVIECPEG